MSAPQHRLDLVTETGRKLVAEVRAPAGLIGDAAIVRVFSPDRPGAPNLLRVSSLRQAFDRIEHMGFEDTDPLSVGRGNIREVLVWIDEMNRKRGG